MEDELVLEVGMRNVTAAMEAAGVDRLIALSGAAVDLPGDRKPLLDRLASVLVRPFARHVVSAKQREYEIFSAAGLDWTALPTACRPSARSVMPSGRERRRRQASNARGSCVGSGKTPG